MTAFRTERDSMGEVRLPAHVFYGPQTQRAVENFPISGRTLPPKLIHALGLIKWAAATVNRDLGRLSLAETFVSALLAACREVADGKLDDQFPVNVFQTGSGTSSNMNANEVIANRAMELAGDREGQVQFAGTARPTFGRCPVLRTNWTSPLFPQSMRTTTSTSVRARTTCFRPPSTSLRLWRFASG